MRHRTAELEPTKIGGRYTLLRRLAVGGMAEIYLARQAAMAGFEKEVVIKRLRAELADDPRIVEMFLDEARIGALLNHPNIVHVYDVDENDGIPYIAMEYIVGEELNELCRRGIQHGRFLPIEHAVELIRQAATGLGYFHAKRGAEGTPLHDQPLEIVHLDISPTNLLVTQDGTMKVIDFGIARARGQRVRTDVLPGKLSYMSPEQAQRGPNAEPVDHRSDIFSLGIVLYEITVGRRLFRGTPQEIVPKLLTAQIEPPTFARRNFPAALESIVMRTLERHPADRYQTAYDLADDLEAFLRDARLHSGPVRIARYLDMLTHAAGGTRRPELVSEAEAKIAAGLDDLDFDSQVFDGYRPSDGAPGPEQAPEWEDQPQPDGEVAAALGMELAELRALRTPVPVLSPDPDMGTEPAPEPAVLVPTPIAVETRSERTEQEERDEAAADDDAMSVTNPRPKVDAAGLAEGTGSVDVVTAADTEADIGDLDDPPAPPPRPGSQPVRPPTESPFVAKPIAPSRDSSPLVAKPSAVLGGASVGHDRRASDLVPPTVGAGLLARPPSQLPWVLVLALGLAVLALVAYIVTR